MPQNPDGKSMTGWHRRKWVRIGGLVLLLGLAALVAAPFLVPADRYRALLVRFIEADTGRNVEIGALRLYLVPAVHIHVANVRIENPQGFPRGDTIVVQSLDLGLAPRALLSRKLEVTRITVGGVRLNFLSNPSGRTNYELPPPVRRAPPGKTAAAGRAPLLALGRIGAIRVTHVEIALASYDPRTRRIAPSLTLSGLNAGIPATDLSTPDWPRKLEILTDLRGARLTTPSLTKPVQFKTGELAVKGGAGRGTFSASLGGMRATGTVAIAHLDPLSVAFTVAVPELDIGALERVMAATGASAPAPPPSGPRRLLARGKVTVGRLVLSPLQATRVSGRLSVYTNAIDLDAYALSAYGGSVRGTAALNPFAAGLPAAVTAAVRGVNLSQVVSVLAPGAWKVTGVLSADLRLATALGRDPMGTLAGAGTFAVRNGSFPGLDLKGALAQIARALPFNAPVGETRFSYFGGDVRIARERVYSNALRLDGEGLEGTARGSFGFNRTLDYAGTGALTGLRSGMPVGAALPLVEQMLGRAPGDAADVTGIRVPFALRGTLSDPKFSLAGRPQLLGGSVPQQQPAPQPQRLLPSLPPDLLKFLR